MSLDITRIEAAHRSHAAAVETIQRLTGQLDTAFAHLEAGQDRLAQEGVDTTLRMPDWMQAAYTHWRTGQQHVERERVTERMAMATSSLHASRARVTAPGERGQSVSPAAPLKSGTGR